MAAQAVARAVASLGEKPTKAKSLWAQAQLALHDGAPWGGRVLREAARPPHVLGSGRPALLEPGSKFGVKIWRLEIADKAQSHGQTELCSSIFT